MIPIFEPYFKGNERKYLIDCIDTTWVSSQGKYILEFESKLAEFHDMNYGIATSNCTSALHLALKALGIGPGDEVICPALTFISPANMVSLTGAKLVLVDIDRTTLTIDPLLIENSITKKTKAIIVVHQFGHASHMDEIMELAKKFKLKVIEDNAESIGARYKGQLLGTIGDISTNSFFGNKIITAGEGGAIITNNKEIADKCRQMRDHGMDKNKKYHHLYEGYNYRMTNLQAAIGLAQTEYLNQILKKRKKQMEVYYRKLTDVNHIHLREFASWTDPVNWLITIRIGKKHNRDDLIKHMRLNGVECRQMIFPVHYAEHFKSQFRKGQFPVAEEISLQSLHLPSSTGLKKSEISHVVNSLKKFLT